MDLVNLKGNEQVVPVMSLAPHLKRNQQAVPVMSLAPHLKRNQQAVPVMSLAPHLKRNQQAVPVMSLAPHLKRNQQAVPEMSLAPKLNRKRTSSAGERSMAIPKESTSSGMLILLQKLKVGYRQRLLRNVINKIDSGSGASELAKSVSVLDACKWVSSATKDIFYHPPSKGTLPTVEE